MPNRTVLATYRSGYPSNQCRAQLWRVCDDVTGQDAIRWHSSPLLDQQTNGSYTRLTHRLLPSRIHRSICGKHITETLALRHAHFSRTSFAGFRISPHFCVPVKNSCWREEAILTRVQPSRCEERLPLALLANHPRFVTTRQWERRNLDKRRQDVEILLGPTYCD